MVPERPQPRIKTGDLTGVVIMVRQSTGPNQNKMLAAKYGL